MRNAAQRLLGLAPSEAGRALPLFVYLFLTMAGSVASRAARDALFLDRFAATALPYVDIAVAVLVGLLAGVYVRLGAHTNLRNVQIASLLAFAATAVGFWWAARQVASSGGAGVLFVLIYVWVGALSVWLPAQVWLLAGYVMTTREAKRAFGLIGSGAILGWMGGGLATREIAARYGTESTLLWVALTLAMSALLVRHVWRARPEYASADHNGAATAHGGLLVSIRLVRDSRYLTAIAAVICLAAFVTTVAGWQFKAIAKANIPATDDLTMFFGAFNMAAGAAALALQVLVTGRLLRSLGIGVALFIVPVAMMVSSAGLLVWGTLAAVAVLKASDQVLRYSIDKATVELLYLPVPSNLVFRAKSFIDTVIYRFGDALGGAAVLLFAAWLQVGAVEMAWVVLAGSAGWVWAVLAARRLYVENLRESIHQHRVDAERASAPVLERAATDLIAARLKGDPEDVAYALHLLDASPDCRVPAAVVGLLDHSSADVRAQAVRLLAREGHPAVMPRVEALLRDEHLAVRTEALLYLTQHAHIDPLARIEALGDFADFSLRAAMAAFLARPGRTQNVEAARALISAMAKEGGEAGRRTRLEAAQLLATVPDLFEGDLRLLLGDPDAEVAGAAIRAVGRLRKRSLVPLVVKRLADPDLTAVAVATFASLGDPVCGTLRDYLVDPATPADIRREIPGVLQAIGTPAAQFVLLESVLDRDTIVRHRVITALNKLGQIHPERRIDRRLIETVLAAEIMAHYRSYQVLGTLGAALHNAADPVAQRLRASMQQEAERVFRLLKILHPEHDLHSVFVGLQSGDPGVHDNAIEFLETVLAPQQRSLIVPLFDRGVSDAERAHLAGRLLGASFGDREEAVAVLTLSQDPWLQSCAAYAIGEFQIAQFAARVQEWCASPDPLLRATAEDAWQKLQRVQR